MSQVMNQVGTVVIGLGIAGRVRVRDIKEQTNGITLRGVVSRRPSEMEDVPSFTLEETLSCQDVQALIICTENALHEEYAQKGLEHNKHVLVEFPLALSSQKAKELHQLAMEKGLVLWEEDIALLTECHLAVKAKAATTEIKSVDFSLTGRNNGWIENFSQSGLPFMSGISSLQTMMDLFGDLNVLGASLNKGENSYVATANLETQSHKPITIRLTRTAEEGVKRTKLVIFEFEDGEIIDTSKFQPTKPPMKQGLFMKDLNGFYQAVLCGKTPDEAKKLTLKSLEIAEKIHSFF